MAASVYCNRGVLTALIHVAAIEKALAAKRGGTITGEDVKNGMERIEGLTEGGLGPPLTITPTDHEGGGWLQVWQVKGGHLVRVTDWFKAYPDVVARMVQTSSAR